MENKVTDETIDKMTDEVAKHLKEESRLKRQRVKVEKDLTRVHYLKNQAMDNLRALTRE